MLEGGRGAARTGVSRQGRHTWHLHWGVANELEEGHTGQRERPVRRLEMGKASEVGAQ